MTEPTKITALDNGPFLVSGSFVIRDGTGQAYRCDRSQIALCRCGRSSGNPFCDGTHAKVGFSATERAVPQA
ncbi:CDGSH iron-sulfur domain-containing protein [Chamaesiphon sp. VAR_48_metabat_135_sub]|uniref:CDGSH iron-sulfur domain-containing protein n=1 Tax=Chamaesiphon sp. VAR_48_metabat_135_sub TaxID=2964699 RepID=UPI00286C3ECF|nr:CDGSH iron-sulfur domain-containing protein [Chamaesiphon sp. VAR_48_metabat_135_sub]